MHARGAQSRGGLTVARREKGWVRGGGAEQRILQLNNNIYKVIDKYDAMIGNNRKGGIKVDISFKFFVTSIAYVRSI